MVPNGHPATLEPGALVQDALRLVDHARQVLAAAIRLERAHGSGDAVITGFLDAADPGLAVDLMIAADPMHDVHSDAIADRLFEIDAWVCRHAEPDDPIASTQPVTDATTRHLTGPV